MRNVQWTLLGMAPNGWLADCCLSDATRPLTHTLGYALRGIIEAWRFHVNTGDRHDPEPWKSWHHRGNGR